MGLRSPPEEILRHVSVCVKTRDWNCSSLGRESSAIPYPLNTAWSNLFLINIAEGWGALRPCSKIVLDGRRSRLSVYTFTLSGSYICICIHNRCIRSARVVEMYIYSERNRSKCNRSRPPIPTKEGKRLQNGGSAQPSQNETSPSLVPPVHGVSY